MGDEDYQLLRRLVKDIGNVLEHKQRVITKQYMPESCPDNKIPVTLTILKPKSYIFGVYCPIGLKFGGE